MRTSVNGILEPIAALLATNMSPTSKVSSIDPDVMTKVCSRKDLRKKKSTKAIRMDLTHSITALGCLSAEVNASPEIAAQTLSLVPSLFVIRHNENIDLMYL
tara:strand:- start:3792 stop:4097 length:306 start_codon:yes stop_codon:yes gene_type:complete